MRLGFVSIFYFTALYLLVQSGLVILPEPLQSIIVNYGMYFIYIAVGITAVPIALACMMMAMERDRDISRSEPWEEEPSDVSIMR